MNQIIHILLTIILFQLLGIGYIKFLDKNKIENKAPIKLDAYSDSELKILITDSIKEIVQGSKKLPQSTEYTVWDKKTVEHIGKKIIEETKYRTWDDKKIDYLSQMILKESKVDTITIVKEKKEKIVTIDKIENNKEPIEKRVKIAKKTKSIKEKVKIAKKRNIKKTKSISIDQKLEKYAKAKLGQKYVWGATGPNKFDCSGFTRYIFRSTAGIKIPRVSRDQAKVGKYIKNIKDLRRGDMVFFDTEKRFTGKVNHVGIYLSNGNFIHASSARKKVIITNFNKKPFYKKRFLWGRRVINVNS